ncbi:DUF7130 family rubredoxin-like protein [Halovivax gelatinilyticus]|uniref:DUF7130 family rubredoxin-like protein n=1 Tax=Halovivax gelatinilyticus TaxID=2961597 RepID=UPI0020CA29F7|nr:hypothetical protein [Halovivax gelatinilyticus]
MSTPPEGPTQRDELRNKEETELPIGESSEPETRGSTLWRCGDCGEMGALADSLPAECPACAAPREVLFYWEED